MFNRKLKDNIGVLRAADSVLAEKIERLETQAGDRGGVGYFRGSRHVGPTIESRLEQINELRERVDALENQRDTDNEQIAMVTDLCYALMDHLKVEPDYKPGRLEMRKIDEP